MAGVKDWAHLEVLQAAHLNDYLMSQAVPRFTTDTARGTAIPSPVLGQLSYVQEAGFGLQMYTGTWETIMLPNGNRVVPAGGTTGQVLAKASDVDGDVQWVTL